MKRTDHPEGIQEQSRFNTTVAHITQKLNIEFDHGATYRVVKNSLQEIHNQRQKEYKAIQKKPYIGRVDIELDGKVETYYIGESHFPDPEVPVYSWHAEQIGNWFYKSSPERLLKRTFEIVNNGLDGINDEFVHAKLSGKLATSKFGDTLLVKLLRENRGDQLGTIVATIQEQQYRIIQSPAKQLLIVQGVPGSGKSAIALHRVAYLLFNDDKKNPQLKNILIIGPNRMFMEYVAEVLPALGQKGILQKTVDDWFVEKLRIPITYISIDRSMEMLLSLDIGHSIKLLHFQVSQIKGSLRMGSLLEHYVELLDTLPDHSFLECILQSSPTISLKSDISAQRTLEDIKLLQEKYKELPLYLKREAIKKDLISSLTDELVVKIRDDNEVENSFQSPYKTFEFRKQIENIISGRVTEFFREWHEVDLLKVYRKLLRSPQLLQAAGSGFFEAQELALLFQESSAAMQPFMFSDLPALVYFKILLEGINDGKTKDLIDHLVIDEAQDLSPMHFKVFSKYLREVSVTLLGDIVQGIYTHSGITDWEELRQIFDQEISKEIIKESYRATEQITDYANKLLKRAGTHESLLAQSIARSGSQPELHSFVTKSDCINGLIKIIGAEQSAGRNSIALICKTSASCRLVEYQLITAQFTDFSLIINQNDSIKAKSVVIVPTYLAKGLEFDVVVIVDAEETTYLPQIEDARLLYVALTRASHTLHICFTGRLTSLLDIELPLAKLESSLSRDSVSQRLTVAEYLANSGELDLDQCIEFLAATDKLYLLVDGFIDKILLDAVLGFRSVTNITRFYPNWRPLYITDKLVVDVIESLENSQKAEDKQKIRQANEKQVLIQLVYGLVRSQLLPGIGQTEDDGHKEKEILKQLTVLKKVYESVCNGVQLQRLKWITSDNFTGFVANRLKQYIPKLLNQLIEIGYVEEASMMREPFFRIPEGGLIYLIELVLNHILDNEISNLPGFNYQN